MRLIIASLPHLLQLKKTRQTAKKANKGVKKITITHPFHPAAGKKYEYLCMTKFYRVEYVTCIDEQGKRCMFPVSITDLPNAYDTLGKTDCVITIDGFVSLKELLDNIVRSHEV